MPAVGRGVAVRLSASVHRSARAPAPTNTATTAELRDGARSAMEHAAAAIANRPALVAERLARGRDAGSGVDRPDAGVENAGERRRAVAAVEHAPAPVARQAAVPANTVAPVRHAQRPGLGADPRKDPRPAPAEAAATTELRRGARPAVQRAAAPVGRVAAIVAERLAHDRLACVACSVG